MQAADLIQKILKREGITSEELAARIGVDPSFMSRCASGARQPGDMVSVLLAGFAEGDEERAFWLEKSKLNSSRLRLLAAAIGATEPEILTGEERRLLDWWRQPRGAVEESVKSVVEKLLELRAQADRR